MASSRATPSDAHRPYRLPRIIALLRAQPLPAEVLLPRLNALLRQAKLPGISLRALQRDLGWLLEHLGDGGIERVAKSDLKPAPPPEFHRFRQFYRLIGAEDLIPTTGDLVFITELEALALVAARAQLASPPAPGTKAAGAGPLADALGQLIRRLGFSDKDNRIPDILAVTHAAPQPYDPVHLLTAMRAIRLGDGLAMQYRSLTKPTHEVVAQPVRMVLVEGEPYLWAFDAGERKLKNYKFSRMESLAARPPVPDLPAGLDGEVRAQLSGGFRGVAGDAQRGRVVVRLSKGAVPHLRHRRMGGSQTWEDLPDGGARIAFNTSGIDAVKHWLLQCGSEAVVEAPLTLVDWFRAETARMAATYRR
ncbi:hypothetical protein LBMAG53_39680 [Planctomycetota bacterium]|nr:hypothetical protein LBMAG53_39680 [Planctomycetota bacterium]